MMAYETGTENRRGEAESELDFEGFKQLIINSETSLPPSLASLPARINIGTFGDALDRLVTETSTDSQTRERALPVKLGLNRQLLLLSTPIIGTQNEVEYSVPLRRNGVATEKVVASLHSHPKDHPASPEDLRNLLLDQTDEGWAAVFLGTPGMNYLFLRTLETPDMPREEVDRLISAWNKELYERYRLIPSYGSFRAAQVAIVNNDLVRKICRQYHIAIYCAEAGREFSRASD